MKDAPRITDPLDDLDGEDFHRAADETNDAADHDELHAAGVVLGSDPIWAVTTPYIVRWLRGLVERHSITHDDTHDSAGDTDA